MYHIMVSVYDTMTILFPNIPSNKIKASKSNHYEQHHNQAAIIKKCVIKTVVKLFSGCWYMYKMTHNI